MLRRRFLPALALPLAFSAVAAATGADVPAGADESTCAMVTDDAGTCRIEAWLNCDEAVGGKVNFFTTVTLNATLGLEAPTGSAQEGEFCGEPENSATRGAAQDNIHVFTFDGNLEGNFQDMTVNLYDLALSQGRSGSDVTLSVRVTIDGKSPSGDTVGGTTGDIASPTPFDVVVTPVDGNQGATQQYTFTLVGLDQHIKRLMADGWKAKGAHQIRISIDSPADGAHAWVWGGTEIPAGVILNPTADDELGTIVEFAPAE